MCTFAEAICISQRLYAFFRRGYMHFAEAIFSFAEAICSKIENNNHLSPVDTEAGTELGPAQPQLVAYILCEKMHIASVKKGI